jgi:hypothetical protein
VGLASFGLEIWLQSLYQLQSLPSSIGTATESPAKFICESLVIKCFGMPINAHFKHVQVAPCSAFPLGATALSSFSRAVAARFSRAYELHLCTPGSCRGRVGTLKISVDLAIPSSWSAASRLAATAIRLTSWVWVNSFLTKLDG